jgi:hypothetical protein
MGLCRLGKAHVVDDRVESPQGLQCGSQLVLKPALSIPGNNSKIRR